VRRSGALGVRCAPLVCTGGWPSAAVTHCSDNSAPLVGGCTITATSTGTARIHQALAHDIGVLPWRYDAAS
jgi:hypothetical protein